MRAGRGAKKLMGLTAIVMLLGAACGKSSSPSTSPTQPSATSPSSNNGSPSAAGVTVQQGAGGFVFAPSTLTVKEGVSLTVTNVGSVSHTFTITGKKIDVVNSPGQSQNVIIDLTPGTYQFICRFHVSLGMKGTLNVTD